MMLGSLGISVIMSPLMPKNIRTKYPKVVGHLNQSTSWHSKNYRPWGPWGRGNVTWSCLSFLLLVFYFCRFSWISSRTPWRQLHCDQCLKFQHHELVYHEKTVGTLARFTITLKQHKDKSLSSGIFTKIRLIRLLLERYLIFDFNHVKYLFSIFKKRNIFLAFLIFLQPQSDCYLFKLRQKMKKWNKAHILNYTDAYALLLLVL